MFVCCVLVYHPKENINIHWLLSEWIICMTCVLCLKTLMWILLCNTCFEFIGFLCIICVNFNGLNFSNWNEQVQFHLGILDLDLAMLEEKFVTITDASSNEEKAHYKAWERSNRLSLILMRMTVVDSIKTTLPKIESAKKFMWLVGERSQTADKSVVGTLMSTLTTMKFDGSRTMYEHVIEMTNIATRLKTLGI